MSTHLVVGAGAVATQVATLLLERGDDVRIVSRSGSGPEGTQRIALDASDAEALARHAEGVSAIYNCANPAYDRWADLWPPMAAALDHAARASGAVLVATNNLYGYGPVSGPMVEGMPDAAPGTKGRVRAAMTARSLAAHRDGTLRYAEVRAGDFLGGDGILSTIVVPALLKGRTAFVPADLDAPHTWTSTADVARTLVAVADTRSAWGRVWHVPSPEPASIRRLSEVAAAQLDRPLKLRSMPGWVLWTGGLFNPFVRELRETQYQFRAPFVMDSSDAQRTLGIAPMTLDDAVALDLRRSAQRS